MSRLNKMLEKMNACGMPAALVTSEINQRYLTGFAFTDGYVLITPARSYLVTDSRYVEAAGMAVDAKDFEVVAPDDMLGSIRSYLSDLGIDRVAVEEATLSLGSYDKIEQKLPGITLVRGASALIDGLRLYKDEDEIALMQRAQDITDAAFAHILDYITPERTEIEVALELEFFMRAHGAESVAFDTIAVSGTASSLPHGVPRPVKLEKGFFTMDFGARVDGYCSDMTRTVVIGKADDEMRRLYDTVLRAQTSALAQCAEGVSCFELDKIARDIIEDAGYHGAFGHSLGHGVGMYIHEAPRLSFAAPRDSLLTRGHVVTFEPGIYLAGKYGCRIEDMVAITPTGQVHNFTASPKHLIEIL